MKTYISFLLFLIFAFGNSQIQISGKVSYKNKGIKDVSVTLKDTYDGATTDETGNFSFQTWEKGKFDLVFSHPKFVEYKDSITIENRNLVKNVTLKETFNEIDALVISVGSIEASDKKRAAALLTPVDIYTTAGADGQITAALTYLPGVQRVGESEGLFIRGGTGTESKIFMDGNLINNYYSSSVPGIAGRERFNTSLFKGNVFSSGGYSALYGQALSGVLILESVDLPNTSSYDFGVSPIFISGGLQRLSRSKTYSYGASAAYSNLDLMQNIFKFNTDFSTAPQGIGADANFRIQTKRGGMFKYYGSYDQNKMAVHTENETANQNINLNAHNTFHTLSYREKIGKYGLNFSTSFANNQNDLGFQIQDKEYHSEFDVNEKGNYFNLKGIVDRKLGIKTNLRAGFELNNASESTNFNKKYRDLISSFFAESDWSFNSHFSAKLGLRAEHSSFLHKSNIAPRVAVAYRMSPNWTSSFAYGLFYQNPESKYLNSNAVMTFQKAEHFIFQLQRNSEGRSLRLEAFLKNYDKLTKTKGDNYIQTAYSNNGDGQAKGLEFFWKDKKTFKTIDYWITYSYLNTQRDFLNFPIKMTPNFAAKHTLSLVAKKFVTPWKTQFNISYSYASGRPYYDIVTDNGSNILREYGSLKDYSSLNFSVNYLPNLGKKDTKAFTVFVLSVSNILGNNTIYGYNFSQDGRFKSPIIPPIKTFVFLGAFVSFGVDKTNDAINNNL